MASIGLDWPRLASVARRRAQLTITSMARGYWQSTPCAQFEVHPHRAAALDAARFVGVWGGAWSACTHLSTYGLNVAPFFMRFLALQLKPQSALEFGCGLGTTADFLARFTPGGSRVTCIEPNAMDRTEVYQRRPLPQRPTQLAFDALTPSAGAQSAACSAEIKATRFELVYSLEVAEHIPAALHPRLTEILSNATGRLLVFSSSNARNSIGHLRDSLRSQAEWRALFERHGLVYLPRLSNMARRMAYPERVDITLDVIVMRAADASVEDVEESTLPELDRKQVMPRPPNTLHFDAKSHRAHLLDLSKVAYFQASDEARLWPELYQLVKSGGCSNQSFDKKTWVRRIAKSSAHGRETA